MALTLTIGVPGKTQEANSPASYINFVNMKSIVIQNSVQVAADTFEFDLVIYNNEIDAPKAGNEVIFKDGSSLEFGGVLLTVNRRFGPEKLSVIYRCSCKDYIFFLNRRLINKLYASQAAGQTVKDILTDLHSASDSDIHYEFFKDNVTNVDNGANLAAFTFDKMIPSQALDIIAQSTGMQWWIDFDKNIYFKVLNASVASHLTALTLNIDTDQTSHYNFEESESIDGIASQLILRDMRLLSTSNQVDEFLGSEGKSHNSGKDNKIFFLSRTPFTFLNVSSVTKDTGGGDVAQTLNFEDIDGSPPGGEGGSTDVYIYVKDEGSYVRFSDSNTVGDTDTIKITYKYTVTDDLEDPDFAAVDQLAERTGGDGIHQFLYSQTSGMKFTNLDDAEHVLQLLRERKSKILRRGSFSSWVKGWQAGQKFTRNWSTELGIEEMFVISVTKIVLTPNDDPTLSDNVIESQVTFSNIPYGIAF